MTPPQIAGRVPVAGFYLLHFAVVGVVMPFLPAYLKSLSLSGTQVGVLLALTPMCALWAPPLWGHLADRLGRPDRVLSVIMAGATLAFLPLAFVQRFEVLLAVLGLYAVFASSVTTVIDSITLQRVIKTGGNYAHLRLFGSLGFVITATTLGFTLDEVDRRVVIAGAMLLASAFLWTWTLRVRTAIGPRASAFAGLKLLRNRDLRLFLLASSLHWIAGAPFHGIFSIHVVGLGLPPSVVGSSAALGVLVEIGVLLYYPKLAARFAPRHLLAFTFFFSAARWVGMSLATTALPIVLITAGHGLTFGLFFVATVQAVASRVPAHLRATGQALLVSATFGVGGLIGFLSAGAGYDWLGGSRLFAVAAAVQLIPAFLMLRVEPPPEEALA